MKILCIQKFSQLSVLTFTNENDENEMFEKPIDIFNDSPDECNYLTIFLVDVERRVKFHIELHYCTKKSE